MSLKIINAKIVDGSGNNAYSGEIYVENKKISRIVREGDNIDVEVLSDEIVDAKGKVVCPGFIDTHSHSDLALLERPQSLPKILQGVTTEILGQDGISMAPLPEENIEKWKLNLAGLDGVSDKINWHYHTTEGYLKYLESVNPAVNLAYLIPHGNIRMEVLGINNKEANEEELKQMCNVLRREMEAGGIGLSTGLIYIPCAYGNTNELIELCKVVAEYDGALVIHQRSEADTILDSMKEVIEIGKKSGVKIHFSHFKVCGKNNWDKIDDVIKLLEEAEKDGIRVSFDQYPYVAGSTMLGVALPSWAHDGGTDILLERLNDKKCRDKMKRDIIRGIEGWDNFIQFAGFDKIFITSVKTEKNKKYIGKSLEEIARDEGKDNFDAMFDLILEEDNAVGMVDFYGTEEHVARFMKRPEMNVCTDGLLGGKPHPRVYGTFPRVLGKYVRENKILTLEEAIYKMTYKAANVMNLNGRGLIKEGFYADIVIFDPNKIIDKGTFTDPIQYPEGIDTVIVNGEVEVAHGNYMEKRAGMVIKNNNK